MECKNVVSRVRQLESERAAVQQQWQVIERFVMPYRGQFFRDESSENSVNWRKREILDSTAVHAAQSLAASLHGSLTSPAIKWFELKFRDENTSGGEADEWLAECDKIVWESLQDSNFNLEANETYLDLVGYGSSVIFEEAVSEVEWKGVSFGSVPIKECHFEEDHNGQIYNFYRVLHWRYSQIVSKFCTDGGMAEADLPKRIRDMKDHPDDKMHICFCVYTRQDKISSPVDGILAPKNRPYGYKYVIMENGKLLGEEGGYYEMPAFIPRWRKTSGSRWGNSPAMTALADILQLNETKMLKTRAVEKGIEGTWFVNERAGLTDLQLDAATVNVMKDINGIRQEAPMGRMDWTDTEIADLRDSVRSYFMADQLELKESPAMTATEVQVRYELMQRLLGPTLGRLQSDFLEPMIQRTFNLLLRGGQLPEMPNSVYSETGEPSRVDVEYLGPLNRAQQIDSVASTERLINAVMMIAELKPTVVNAFDWDEAAWAVADKLGISPKVVNTAEETAALTQQQEAAAAAAQQAETAKMAGQARQADAMADQTEEQMMQ